MSNDIDREDTILGTALARAIESQPVRETPFERSRLAQRLARARRGLPWAGLAAAATLVLAVGFAAFVLAPRPTPGEPVAAEPGATPTAAPTPAEIVVPTPTPANVVRQRVYFARDQLPPVGVDVDTTPSADTPAERTRARLAALASATAPAGAANMVPGLRTRPSLRDVTVDGDLVRVDFDVPNGDWGVAGSAASLALIQQLVYTASEEPGVRRVIITENGGKPTIIDQVEVDRATTREDVFGYAFKGSEVTSIENAGSDVEQEVTGWMASNGLLSDGQLFTAGRVSVEVHEFAPPREAPAPSDVPARRLDPTFKAELAPVTKACTDPSCVGGKWRIALTLPSTSLPSRQPTVMVDFIGGPIRGVDGQIVSPSCGPGASACAPFTLITIYLDDARPWRVSVEPTGTVDPRGVGTARINVDVGGRPSLVNRNIVVYGLEPGDAVPRRFTVTGAARVFEANVAWRLRDASGKQVAQGHTTASVGTSPIWGTFEANVEVPSGVTGRVTLEVFWASPKDGSDQDVVEIPLTVR